MIVASIIKSYGRLEHKINFIQSLRSKEDFIFKHTLNVAMLCAMMSKMLRFRMEEQVELVTAAVLHDIGKLELPKEVIDKRDLSPQEEDYVNAAVVSGFELIEDIFGSSPNIRRICVQSQKGLSSLKEGKSIKDIKFVKGSKVMMAAGIFDEMTAMQMGRAPDSPVWALKFLLEHEDWFGYDVVDSLIRSINILSPGVCVELNTREKGLVIRENELDVLRPVILTFQNNEVFDLSIRAYDDVEIVDVMRTLDNRYIMDVETLKENGYYGRVPEFVEPTPQAQTGE